MRKGTLFVISAASGTGKTSLVNALKERKNLNLQVSISYTTRSKRPGEEDGIHYHFVKPDVFQAMIKKQEFLEYAEVFQHFYGTSKNTVLKQLQEGFDVILEIDWQGAAQVRKSFPETITIFILPPSLHVLKERLLKRAQDSLEVVQQRLEESRAEISHFNEFDYLVVNDDFDTALNQLTAIIQAAHCERVRNLLYWQNQVQLLL